MGWERMLDSSQGLRMDGDREDTVKQVLNCKEASRSRDGAEMNRGARSRGQSTQYLRTGSRAKNQSDAEAS